MKKHLNDLKTATRVVYKNCDILIIPYIFFIIITVISNHVMRKYDILAIGETAGVNPSQSLILLPILLGITGLIATTSVHYQLANIYNDQKAGIFEGAKRYFGKFLGFYLIFFLIMVIFVVLFFGNNYAILQGKGFIDFIITYFIVSFTTFSHISMIVNNSNPLSVFKDVLTFIVTRFTKIIVPTLLAFTGYYIVNQATGYLQSLYSGVIVFSITSIVYCCILIWLKSCFTLIYKNNLQDIIDDKKLDNYISYHQ